MSGHKASTWRWWIPGSWMPPRAVDRISKGFCGRNGYSLNNQVQMLETLAEYHPTFTPAGGDRRRLLVVGGSDHEYHAGCDRTDPGDRIRKPWAQRHEILLQFFEAIVLSLAGGGRSSWAWPVSAGGVLGGWPAVLWKPSSSPSLLPWRSASSSAFTRPTRPRCCRRRKPCAMNEPHE